MYFIESIIPILKQKGYYGADIDFEFIPPQYSKAYAAFAERCEKYKHSVFGSASLLWYLCATENEVKNIRIIIAGRAAGQSAEKIIERIRESYV